MAEVSTIISGIPKLADSTKKFAANIFNSSLVSNKQDLIAQAKYAYSILSGNIENVDASNTFATSSRLADNASNRDAFIGNFVNYLQTAKLLEVADLNNSLISSGRYASIEEIPADSFNDNEKIDSYLNFHALFLSALISKIGYKYELVNPKGDIKVDFIPIWNLTKVEKNEIFKENLLIVNHVISLIALENKALLLQFIDRYVATIIESIKEKVFDEISEGENSYVANINIYNLIFKLTTVKDKIGNFSSVLELTRLDKVKADEDFASESKKIAENAIVNTIANKQVIEARKIIASKYTLEILSKYSLEELEKVNIELQDYKKKFGDNKVIAELIEQTVELVKKLIASLKESDEKSIHDLEIKEEK